MATHTPLSGAQIEELLRGYVVAPFVSVRGIPEGSVNSNFEVTTRDRRYFLRVYEEQDTRGAERDARLSVALAERGVATPPPLERRDGGRIGQVAGKPAALFAWVPGDMRCQRAVTPLAAERVGRQLALVHQAGPAELAGPSRFGERELLDRIDRIAKDARFADAALRLRPLLHACTTKRSQLPTGLVHGDLFRDNVLWSGDEVSALLDFESASVGAFAFDLSVTMLAWCFGDAFDAALASAMIAGYESARKLEPDERRGMFEEARFAALRFTITRITDYAMRGDDGSRVMKDHRRFEARLEALDAMGPSGFERLAFG